MSAPKPSYLRVVPPTAPPVVVRKRRRRWNLDQTIVALLWVLAGLATVWTAAGVYRWIFH